MQVVMLYKNDSVHNADLKTVSDVIDADGRMAKKFYFYIVERKHVAHPQ